MGVAAVLVDVLVFTVVDEVLTVVDEELTVLVEAVVVFDAEVVVAFDVVDEVTVVEPLLPPLTLP